MGLASASRLDSDTAIIRTRIQPTIRMGLVMATPITVVTTGRAITELATIDRTIGVTATAFTTVIAVPGGNSPLLKVLL